MTSYFKLSDIHASYGDFMADLASKPPATTAEHEAAARTLLQHAAIHTSHFGDAATGLALTQMAAVHQQFARA